MGGEQETNSGLQTAATSVLTQGGGEIWSVMLICSNNTFVAVLISYHKYFKNPTFPSDTSNDICAHQNSSLHFQPSTGNRDLYSAQHVVPSNVAQWGVKLSSHFHSTFLRCYPIIQTHTHTITFCMPDPPRCFGPKLFCLVGMKSISVAVVLFAAQRRVIDRTITPWNGTTLYPPSGLYVWLFGETEFPPPLLLFRSTSITHKQKSSIKLCCCSFVIRTWSKVHLTKCPLLPPCARQSGGLRACKLQQLLYY